MKLPYLLALASLVASAMMAMSCSGSDGFSCGPGTQAKGSECVVAGGASGADLTAAGAGGDSSDQAGAAGQAGSADTGDAGQGGQGGAVELIQTVLDCGSRNITGATVVSAPITLDTTWSGIVYLPKGLVIKNEPTLTIRPGTKIIVGKGADLQIGFQGSRPKVRALGTVQQPIKFCGETDTAGYWGSVILGNNIAPSSVLRNVLISDGGGTDFELTLQAPVVVQGVQVLNSGNAGVSEAGFSDGSESLTVSGAAGVAVTATAANGVDVPPSSSLTGNQLDLIDVAFTAFDTSVTLRNFGVPYRQQADVTGSKVGSSVVITIESGVVYQMKHQTLLDFGAATLHALGTSDQPIVFQGLLCEQDPGYCTLVPDDNGHAGGGRINLGGGTDLQLSYVELHSMGWTKQRTVPPLDYVPFGALTIATDSALKVDHLKLDRASGWGIELSGRGTFTADSQGIDVNSLPHFSTFTPNPLTVSCGFLMTLPVDTQVSGEPRTSVTCYGTSTLTGTWPAGAGPYILSGFTIEAGGELDLQPGTVLRFLAGTTLRVQSGGTLHASGTDTADIQFIEDTTPNTTVGNWNALIVETGASVVLDHALIDSAGVSDGANIVARGPLTLTNSIISNSVGWGLEKAADDRTDYSISNTFTNNAAGDISDLN